MKPIPPARPRTHPCARYPRRLCALLPLLGSLSLLLPCGRGARPAVSSALNKISSFCSIAAYAAIRPRRRFSCGLVSAAASALNKIQILFKRRSWGGRAAACAASRRGAPGGGCLCLPLLPLPAPGAPRSAGGRGAGGGGASASPHRGGRFPPPARLLWSVRVSTDRAAGFPPASPLARRAGPPLRSPCRPVIGAPPCPPYPPCPPEGGGGERNLSPPTLYIGRLESATLPDI